MDLYDLSDDEIFELEELLKEQDIYERFDNLANPKTANVNYLLLHNAIHKQKYDDEGDLIDGYRGGVLEGSSRCFHLDQLIITESGKKPIKELTLNDRCLSFNHETQKLEYKNVSRILKQSNKKKAFKIVLKDGTEIKCTHDHKFFFNGSYIEIGKILALIKK